MKDVANMQGLEGLITAAGRAAASERRDAALKDPASGVRRSALHCRIFSS